MNDNNSTSEIEDRDLFTRNIDRIYHTIVWFMQTL